MKKNLNLPNALTFLRILMIPAVYITYYQLPERRWIALVIYLLASFTDFLDGYLARKWNQITSFGKLFDPLADKLIVLTVLYCLADTDYAPWWVFFLMLGKEILMVLGSLLMLGKKVVSRAISMAKPPLACSLPPSRWCSPGTTSRRFSRLAMCCCTLRWRLRWFLWAYTPIRPLKFGQTLDGRAFSRYNKIVYSPVRERSTRDPASREGGSPAERPPGMGCAEGRSGGGAVRFA